MARPAGMAADMGGLLATSALTAIKPSGLVSSPLGFMALRFSFFARH